MVKEGGGVKLRWIIKITNIHRFQYVADVPYINKSIKTMKISFK